MEPPLISLLSLPLCATEGMVAQECRSGVNSGTNLDLQSVLLNSVSREREVFNLGLISPPEGQSPSASSPLYPM